MGIPLILFFCLYRVRRRLRDPSVLRQWGLAYDLYLEVYWWWEMVDMIVKLCLTSLLGFLSYDVQCQVGIAVCGVYLISLLLAAPYVRKMDDRMSSVVQIHLILV